MTPRQYAALTALCGMVALATWSVDQFGLGPQPIDNTAPAVAEHDTQALIEREAAARVVSPDSAVQSRDATDESREASPAATGSLGDAAASAEVSSPAAAPEKPPRLVSAFPAKATDDDEILPPVPPIELSSECIAAETCVDDYLWSLYNRTPKVDANKVVTKVKKSVKKDGKIKTFLASITNYVIGDFTWKDPSAAEKAGKPLKEYVIGGMDPVFKLKLFRALRTLDSAGFMPGITSAFRDDYRQSIAEGNKAASDSSFHGGSRRGGFGHGLAADIVSVKGDTRTQRLASSDEMWKWIDTHEKELAIGRPYRDRDPPHVGPLDGKEYAEKRGAAVAREAAAKAQAAKKVASAETKKAESKKAETKKTASVEPKKPALPARHDLGIARPARAEKSAKVSSLQPTMASER